MPFELLWLWLLPALLLAVYWGVRFWRLYRQTEQKGIGYWVQTIKKWWMEKGKPPTTTAGLPTTYTLPGLRLPITLLLLGGLGLIMMGQTVYPVVPAQFRLALFLVILIALLTFLLGTQMIARVAPPTWAILPVRTISRFLAVQPWQLIPLFFAPFYATMAHWLAGPGMNSPLATVAWLAWLMSIGMAVAGSWKWQGEASFRVSRLDLLITIGLLLGAYLLRGTATNQIPTTLSGDEGSVGLTAAQIVKGEFNNPLTVAWFSFPSLYFYLPAAAVALWGNSIEALRIPSALAGTFTVIALYWTAKALFGRPAAVLAAAYLLASHYHIHFSRIGLNNIFDGLFATMVMGGVWYGWKTGKRWAWVSAGIALGLGQYFYVSIRILPLLLLLWVAAAFLFQRQQFRQRLPDLLLCAFVAIIILLPLALFFYQFPKEFTAPLNRVTIFEGWLDHEIRITGLSAAQIIRGQMLKAALGFTHLPLRLLYDTGSPLLLSSAAALFLLGLFMILWDANLRSLFLLLPLLSVVILSGFSQDPPASQRYVLVIPIVSILLTLPLAQLYKWLCQLWGEYRLVITLIIGLATVGLIGTDINYYFGDVYPKYILGGLNTEAATQIANYLQEQETPQDVYFFGFPRMGYYSLSTIPYLNPKMNGVEMNEPLQNPINFALRRDSIFIFLPERSHELEFVRSVFPNGIFRTFYRQWSPTEPLFMVYEASVTP